MWLITMTSPDKRERQVQPNVNRRDDSRRGVALIIVLGFLSIMILMAIAFLTNARTERMVADSSLEAVSYTHLDVYKRQVEGRADQLPPSHRLQRGIRHHPLRARVGQKSNRH